MNSITEGWKSSIARALTEIAEEIGLPFSEVGEVVLSIPPDSVMGDFAVPMFQFAKALKTPPHLLAKMVGERLQESWALQGEGELLPNGPYLNIRFNVANFAEVVIARVSQAGDGYGTSQAMKGERIMIEFSCPNTNKPLHLGHLRNDAIGDSISRILGACGGEVKRVNLINDRGIHICKSMLAYKLFGEGVTPEELGKKGDHLVGDFYVKYNEWATTDSSSEEQVRSMLRDWEAGDSDTIALWKKMNRWAVDGILDSYKRTNIEFDTLYYESDTYENGRNAVLKGVENGVFQRDDDGSVWVDLSEYNLDRKVLLRSDGTSIYLTQDIGTVMARMEDWEFDRLIYVVGSEQDYHFKVLFLVLELYGLEYARRLHHLSYGMVNLPDGKMKSREGKVVDADQLLDSLEEMVEKEMESREEGVVPADNKGIVKKIALGALNYFLLRVSPSKDIEFNPAESIALNGNTGPYLQYMGARITSVLQKYNAQSEKGSFVPSLLTVDDERELIKSVARFPQVVERAGRELNPSILVVYLYELCKTYSSYYHDNRILQQESRDLVTTRATLSLAVLQVLKNGLPLLGIPFLEQM